MSQVLKLAMGFWFLPLEGVGSGVTVAKSLDSGQPDFGLSLASINGTSVNDSTSEFHFFSTSVKCFELLGFSMNIHILFPCHPL